MKKKSGKKLRVREVVLDTNTKGKVTLINTETGRTEGSFLNVADAMMYVYRNSTKFKFAPYKEDTEFDKWLEESSVGDIND